MSMRHWLAGVLARERPALFRALPESFKIGLELSSGAHGVTRYLRFAGTLAPPTNSPFRPRLRNLGGLTGAII
jgi:hypothetical protein